MICWLIHALCNCTTAEPVGCLTNPSISAEARPFQLLACSGKIQSHCTIDITVHVIHVCACTCMYDELGINYCPSWMQAEVWVKTVKLFVICIVAMDKQLFSFGQSWSLTKVLPSATTATLHHPVRHLSASSSISAEERLFQGSEGMFHNSVSVWPTTDSVGPVHLVQ